MFSAFVIEAVAAPMNGEEFTLSQPDGSEVTVLIYGDELSAAAESRDGYTLVRGADGWICYAELSADGSEYVSTGVRYTDKSSAPGGRKGLRINEKSAREKRERNRKNVGDGEEESLRGFRGKFGVRAAGGNNFQPAPAPAPEDEFLPAPGDTTRVVGMVLFIAFPDYPGPTDGAFLRYADSAYNRRGFRGNGSVCDYFDRVSGGNVQYTNYITAWVTAPQPFDYYDGVDNYGRVQVLIDSALASLNRNTAVANQIASQVSTYERNWSGSIGRQKTAMALNIHPIRSGQRWSHGIWSHRGWYRNGNITVGGIRFYDYQFTGLGNSGTVTSSSTVSLGTIAHENGHMLFDWPDLYNYVSGQRNFVSTYCIMSSSGSNPQMPNPYFRSVWSAANAKAPAGWDVVTDITSMNAVLTAPANVNASYRYIRPGSNGQESYFIEARNRRSPSGTIPDSGLIIWHVHTAGDNANYDNTHTNAARRIPKVAVVQANNGSGNPGPNATFRAGSGSGKTAFNRNTTPAARWHSYTSNNAGATSPWSGEYSDINITEISAINSAANNMTFRIGSVGGPVSTPLTAAMLAIPAVTFNGSAQTPVLTVRDGSKTL
ncbi:MAG: hypothetical protein LBB56_00685, partial [Chitinispirillales bacterium]|nr:hypothetical protein [Chitinispirillales bacterium]